MDSRSHIIEATWQLLKEVGCSGTTTKRIAEAAHTNESKLFRIYRDKQDLIAQTLREKYPEKPRLSYEYLTDRKDIKAELGDLLFQCVGAAEFYLVVSHLLAVGYEADLSGYSMSSYIGQLGECFQIMQIKAETGKTDTQALARTTMYYLLQITAVNRSRRRWKERAVPDVVNTVFEMLQMDKPSVQAARKPARRQDRSGLREYNSQAVIEHCMQNEKVVISELVKCVSLSKTTVIRIVNHLLEDGLLLDLGVGDGGTEERGRPPSSYCLNTEYGYLVSISISAKEILVVLLDLKNQPLDHIRASVTNAIGLDEVVLLLDKLTVQMMEKCRLEWGRILGVCIALQGRVDEIEGRSVYASLFHNWPANVSVLDRVRTFIPGAVPVYINNEGVYLTMGEQYYGKARKARRAIVVNISNKLASGILIEDGISGGSYAVAREIAHIQLDSGSSIPCICGSYGCFRALVNTQRAVEIYGKNLKRYPKERKGADSDWISFENIVEEFLQGDPLAVWVFDEIAHWFGLAFSQLSLIYEPEIIIIQGDYVKAGKEFLDIIRRYMVEGKYPFLKHMAPEIVYSSLQNEAMILGSGRYALDEFVKRYVGQKQVGGRT